MAQPYLSGRERTFQPDEIIVTKTDLKGHITYANDVFLRLAGYREEEILGKPHNIIRHPDMPRCVFRLLWDTIQAGREIFAYVVNRASNGDHYWVFAHATPSYDAAGNLVGYHSNRRLPHRSVLPTIQGLYQKLLAVERQHRNPKEAWRASLPVVTQLLSERGVSYEEFIFSLTPKESSETRGALVGSR